MDGSSTSELRGVALALRDLCELTGSQEIALTLDETAGVLVYSPEDGLHLVKTEGEPLDLTEWVDYAGMVPVA